MAKTKNKKIISSEENLQKAIKIAKKQVKEVPALFSAANLKFLTQTEDRLPTLYYMQGNNSG